MNKIGRMCVLILMIACAAPAWATSTTVTSGCVSVVTGISSTINFNGGSAADPAGHATYVNPGFNGGTGPGCGGDWLTQNSSDTTILFDAPIDYFGMAWGTKDSYNGVELYNGATLLRTYTGNDYGFGATAYVNFFADAGEQFTKIILRSGSCCFETDNHSYRLVGTPEPSSILQLGLGLLAGMVLFLKTRRLVKSSLR